MEAYFTSPTLGRVYGTVITENHEIYNFIGRNVLINITLCRQLTGWVCQKDQWLHDFQIAEIGLQIDTVEKWLSAQ
ncbi:hypothetical protein [Mucilaginibacter arboris]|uniref:Uncharacterized protein n=1 Tax=Mucilaginibacter arboris TaxID=2682090 RepID=A0A7K1SVP1_9SPHI|nr:hypothetical protein [Mucilaginibacter arboris]MVN21396.1 hypothetical protein [Mucilaginibacter arboris]